MINEPCISASIDAELTHSVNMCVCMSGFSASLCVCVYVCVCDLQHSMTQFKCRHDGFFNDYSPACVCIFVSICLLCVFPLG